MKTSAKKRVILILKNIGIYDIVKRLIVKRTAAMLYKAHFNRTIKWNNPKEFNEKLRWMQFYTDTSKWTLLADKYRVRSYLENLGYGHLLVKLYGVWKKADDIDFSTLPESFVIKTNHGSGSVFVVKDKTKADLGKIKRQLNKDLSVKFGLDTAEPHYWGIKPVILAEELLHQDGEVSSSLIDYKFYCINGESQFCGVMYNRNIETHTYDVRLYDNTWKDVSHLLAPETHQGPPVPRPINFDKMREFCQSVCKEFPFVRMDFYECGGKLYFGEFTFTPAACTGGSLGSEACRQLSEKLILQDKKD